MIQIKIIKNKTTELLERDINEFLNIMEYSLKNKFNIKDIKLEYDRLNHNIISIIIYEIIN